MVVGIVSSIYAVKIKKIFKKYNSFSKETYTACTQKIALKILGLSILYMVFYFFLGYFIAWQFPKLREFYSGSTNILNFGSHMINQVDEDPGLILFQVFRGALWTMVTYIIANSIGVKKNLEKYLLIGLLLSVGLCTPLFVPNEYMPVGVRIGHFFELLVENFLFGVIAAYVFRSKQNSDFVSIKIISRGNY